MWHATPPPVYFASAVIEYFRKATPPEKEVLVPELSVFDTFPAPMLPARPSLFLVINHSLCCQWTLFDFYKDIESKKVKDLFKDNQKAALCLEDKKYLIRGRGPAASGMLIINVDLTKLAKLLKKDPSLHPKISIFMHFISSGSGQDSIEPQRFGRFVRLWHVLNIE